jgi:5'-nucleotidase
MDVIIRNPEEFKKKTEKFKKDGAGNIHIVADFDRTLTKAFVEGKKVSTTPASVREGRYLTPDYPEKAFALMDKYRPIEFDPKVPLEEKKKKMAEWWTLHFDLMVKSGMNKEVIRDIVKKRVFKMREGAEEFLNALKKNNIPILIFSAGLGDIIKEYLESGKLLTENLHLVSNFFVFDENGKATGYLTPFIHSQNKNEVPIKDAPYYNAIKHRKNVLLLGDTLEDLRMSEGLEHDCIINIGFLNEETKKNLEEFKEAFDIVILNDGSMNYVNKLVNEIL